MGQQCCDIICCIELFTSFCRGFTQSQCPTTLERKKKRVVRVGLGQKMCSVMNEYWLHVNASLRYYMYILLTFKTWRHVLTINPLAKYTAPSAVILLFLNTQNTY